MTDDTPRSPPPRSPPPQAPSQPESRAPCPICGKPAVQTFRPFCSKRCADVDLQRWFSGRYAVPTADSPESEET